MKFLLPLPLLIVLAVAYPSSVEEGDKTIITSDYYPESLVIYNGKHEIVDIMVPLNHIIIDDSSESFSTELANLKEQLVVFFIEADMKDGRREDQGIYMYKSGKATEILNKGRAVAASADDSEYVFLGAEDGLYVYNPDTLKADRYGAFNDSIKDMAKEHNSDVIYILTDNLELYKVYDAASKKEKIEDIKDAQQIMIDYSNNLYYYGKDQKPYVRTSDGETKEIYDLPENAKEIRLLRPPIFIDEGVGLMVDNEMYTIYPDGRSESENLEFLLEAKPTAYSMEAGIYRFFGYKKNIYEYDLLSAAGSSSSSSSEASE